MPWADAAFFALCMAQKIMDKAASVSLTFDDGLRCQFERAVPILDQYGFPATFFLTANNDLVQEPWLGARSKGWRKIDWREGDISALKKIIQDGHEIGSHSVSHKGSDPGSTEFDPNFDPKFEAEESKRLIESRMGIKITSFCYPYCKKPESLKSAVVAAGYKQARAGATGLSYYSPQGSIDLFDVDCRPITANEDVGRWIRPNCLHILMFHAIGDQQDGFDPISVDQFATQMAELAKRRESAAVEVVTFREGAERFRQPK